MKLKRKILATGCVLAASALLVSGIACNEHELAPFSKSLSAGKVQESGSGTSRPVDILFVIDDSESMADEQKDLDENFELFINKLIEANADFHLASVTTTWLSSSRNFSTRAPWDSNKDDKEKGIKVLGLDEAQSEALQAECEAYFKNYGRDFIASADFKDSSLEERKAKIKNIFRCEAIAGTKGGASAIERGLGTMAAVLSTDSQTSDRSKAFKRDGSLLSIVFVTDENDCSDYNTAGKDTITQETPNECELRRNIEDSCTMTIEDRVMTKNSSSYLYTSSGDNVEYNGETKTLREWCVQGDKTAREALQAHYDEIIIENGKKCGDVRAEKEPSKEDIQACKEASRIDCPNGNCKDGLDSRADFFNIIIEDVMLKTNTKYYETNNAEMLKDKSADERKKALVELAKNDVIVASIINRDRGQRFEKVTDKWCNGTGNQSYRYQLFAEMFDNDPIYAPICCNTEDFTMSSSEDKNNATVCKKIDGQGNAKFGPVLGTIGKRIGEAVNTICADTPPLTCKPSDCNDESGNPLAKPNPACPCLYGCNTKTYFANSERAYNLCNEFRLSVGALVDGKYNAYSDGEEYSANFESTYCYTRTGSGIQINLTSVEPNSTLVIEYPKRVSAD